MVEELGDVDGAGALVESKAEGRRTDLPFGGSGALRIDPRDTTTEMDVRGVSRPGLILR